MSRVLSALLGVSMIAVAATVPASQATYTDSTDNAGNSFLAAATVFPSIRVTTYEIAIGAFTGSTYSLALQQDLSSDYFIIMRGAAGTMANNGNRGPDENFARISGDPHGNLGVMTASDALLLERRSTTGDWQGQVTVVESIRDPLVSSFRLLDVVESAMGSGVTTVASTSGTGWTDVNQVGLYGGNYGGGVDSTNVGRNNHQVGWAQVWPSSADTVNLHRESGGGGNLNGTSRFTTYVVEWGTEWSIQRVTVAGNNGGDGVDAVGEYDTASISAVSRTNSFVLAYGRSAENGTGDGFAGATFTLGDGVNQNTIESPVAVGSEYTNSRTAEVYVHTHPDLRVDYRFGTDNGTGITTGAISGTMAVDPSIEPEAYDTTGPIFATNASRIAVVSNSSDGTGTNLPLAFVWARPTANAQVTWTRSRSDLPGAFWLQSIDFALIGP